MRIELIDNISRKVLDAILPAIEKCQECRVAVAFLSRGGLSLVEPALRGCISRGGYVEFLVGLDLSATDADALRSLYRMSQTSHRLACYCFGDLRRSALYHPKLYVMRANETVTILLGSSNLTEGGLRTNVEVNALIQADIQEEIVSDTYEVYGSLKFHKHRVVPDEEFLSLYSELCHLSRKQELAAAREREFRRLKSRFREKASALQRPTATSMDLFGWQRLVFQRLPAGQFKTGDMYQFEEEFRAAYPENSNIRAKVRQILQQLRDLRLVTHVAREAWVRENVPDEAVTPSRTERHAK